MSSWRGDVALPLLRLLAGKALSCLFHWPSVLSLIAWVVCRQSPLPGFCCSLPSSTKQQSWCFWQVLFAEALLFDFAVRVARLAFAVVHELAHIVVALVLLRSSSLCKESVSFWQLCRGVELGDDVSAGKAKPGQLWRRLLEQLLPGKRASGLHVSLPMDGMEQKWQEEVIRCSGVVVSVVFPMIFWAPDKFCAQESWCPGQLAIFLGAVASAAGALLSDLPGGPLLSLTAAALPTGVFCCGNWGCLVPREALDSSSRDEYFPRVLEQLLSNLLNVVELRGAQAGGLATYLRGSNGQIVCARSRVVKSKRGRLGPMLFGKFHRQIRAASWSLNPLTCFRRLRPLPVVLAQGHSRFGTSSMPSENETHPHQWLGNHRDRFWRQEPGKNSWKLEERAEVCITIAHNGDFDGWMVFNEVVPNGDLGEWISRILHKRNPARGDSPKLAGMMDILLVQGRWAACVRLAFIRTVLKHVDEVCDWEELGPEAPNVAPTPQVFKAWAKPFEDVFACVASDFEPTEDGIMKLAHDVCERLEETEFKLGFTEATEAFSSFVVSPDLTRRFCKEACRVFFKNDLMSAVWEFFSRAEGTFGVSISCSLWPQKIVLAAKGQPISLAFDSQRPLVYWASEPASLAQIWPGKGERTPAGRVRWDMLDAQGEIIELQMVQGGTAYDNWETMNKFELQGTLLDRAQYLLLPANHADDEERPFHVMIRGVLFNDVPTPLTRTRFLRRSVLVSIADRLDQNPSKKDVVGQDIDNIPRILAEIDACWQDRNSLNRISAQTFANCLGALLKGRQNAGPDIDVLVFGIENSLWMGQQFAADLARLFPCLNVVAMSSNWVLGMLQSAEGHVEPLNWTMTRRKFQLSPGGICLGVSQSGTTYPSVWASRLLRSLTSRPEIFALGGHYDTVMANGLAGGKIFSGKLFSTLSGISPSEPSTLATMAMHHTFTKLLFYCAEQLMLSGQVTQRVDLSGDSVLLPGGGKKPGCELRLSEVQDLERLSCTLAGTSEEIVGVTQHGIKLPNTVNNDLLQSGRYLSSHLQEPYWSTFLPAIYIMVTVTAGFPLISGTWSLIGEYLVELDLDSAAFLVPKYFAAFLDSILYCCLAAVFATAHRFFTGRRLWTRYTARTVVIVESTANYKLLRAYLSKLRALAWRFTAFSVSGQNGADHFVHEMTHLAHSDSLLVVGRPDGRLSSLAASESSVLMSVQQARYISSKKSGSVEAVCVGHNTWNKEGLWAKSVALPTSQRPLFLSEIELSTQNGEHAPGNVMRKVADFVSTQHNKGKHAVPWIGKQELVARMDGLPEVSIEKAQALVTQIVKEQAVRLKINPSFFEASRFLKPQENSPTSVKAPWADSPRSPRSPRGGFFSSPKTQSRKMLMKSSGSSLHLDGVSISQIMALLRGTKMQEHIADLQEQQRKAETMKHLVATLIGRPAENLLSDVFSGWLEAIRATIKQREAASRACLERWASDRASVHPTTKGSNRDHRTRRRISTIYTGSAENAADCPEWRKNEEIRRYASSRCTKLFGVSQRSCFQSWKDVTAVERAKAGRQKPHKKGSFIVGGGLVDKTSRHNLLAELALQEGLYESRIASAERLLAFFVMFHEAVRGVATLPFLGFDMDRSESRMRVASTPAPIGFVERLPEGGDRVGCAVRTLQNGWLRYKARMVNYPDAMDRDGADIEIRDKDMQCKSWSSSEDRTRSSSDTMPVPFSVVTPDPFPHQSDVEDSVQFLDSVLKGLPNKSHKQTEVPNDFHLHNSSPRNGIVPFGVVPDSA